MATSKYSAALNLLEDIRDALALSFVIGVIVVMYFAGQKHEPHEVRPGVTVTRMAQVSS